jgi:hypothetical protein
MKRRLVGTFLVERAKKALHDLKKDERRVCTIIDKSSGWVVGIFVCMGNNGWRGRDGWYTGLLDNQILDDARKSVLEGYCLNSQVAGASC